MAAVLGQGRLGAAGTTEPMSTEPMRGASAGAGSAPGEQPPDIPDIIRRARVAMSPGLWEYAGGGAESGITVRRNRAALESVAFRPRILAQSPCPELRTTVMGQPVASPVLLAPVGSLSLFDDAGAVAGARAAERHGTMFFVGTLAHPGLAEVAASTQGPLVFQLYVRGDRAWLKDLLQEAEAVGYAGFCLTADSSGNAQRGRDISGRFRLPAMPHPNLPPGGDRGAAHQVAFSWGDFEWLRSQTSLPIAIKGILSAEDAELAVRHGADAVYVSNHGGRELDHLPATVEVLPEIAAAVDGRAEILLDGGVVRGSDVVKALALGARAVLIGKLQVWALAAGGTECLVGALRTLDDEIRHVLRLLGVSRVTDVGPGQVRPGLPVPSCPEDSHG